jgi:hypothetical protein
MITVMLLWNSFNAVLASPLAFEQFYASDIDTTKRGPIPTLKHLAASNLIPPLAVYVLIQLANLGLGVWKCGQMGLLPTTSSDWLAFMEAKQVWDGNLDA